MIILFAFCVAALISLFAPHKKNTAAPLAIFFFIMFICSLSLEMLFGSAGPNVCAIAWLPILLIKNAYDKQQVNSSRKRNDKDLR
jgi:hypothetical protein